MFKHHRASALLPALLVSACTVGTPGEPGGQQTENLARGDVREQSFAEFIRDRRTTFAVAPELNLETHKARLVKEIQLADFTVKMSFRLDPKRSDDLAGLYEGWRDQRDVTVEWGPVFAKVEGLDAREVPVRIEDLQSVLLDPTVRSICGRYKVVGPVTMTVEGQTYQGTVKMSFTSASHTELGEPVDSDAANVACEEETWFLIIDYCGDACEFILPADPHIEATCTLGGIIGMVTGSGTPIVGGGGGQVGVLATATASCWNEFKGTCKLVGAFWGDYCVCSAPHAPKLVCNRAGSPCQGSAGGSCSNPTWSCGSGGGQTVDAGVQHSTGGR
jgi:hypothetical protein